MPICAVCSGSDFIRESGFFFCSECQTQSQDVREELHEYDNSGEEGEVIGGKRKKASKPQEKSAEENMTSWEGFNFALLGLVNELVAMGAKPILKPTVLQLWASYLRKMEVAFFSKSGPCLPKLGPNFRKYDANIIYDYTYVKRTKKKPTDTGSCDEPNPSTSDAVEDNLDRKKTLKQNREAFRRNYKNVIHDMSLTSQSLTNMTLDMLVVSEVDDNEPKELQFNQDAQNNSGTSKKGNFYCHPGIMVRNRLICILYLGLLLCHERINLSDLLRWISEGHLSYAHITKFFPPGTKLRHENYKLFGSYQPSPPYKTILSSTQYLAAYIGLEALKLPSIKELINHYVKELNLPSQVSLLAQRLLNLLPTPSDTILISLRTPFPNIEGRAMAHIVVAMKLLFGLDDATEHRNSSVAHRINKLATSQNLPVQLFVWSDWESFITLRRLALVLFHEPSYLRSGLSSSQSQNINPIISTWRQRCCPSYILSKRNVIREEAYKTLLKRLKEEGNINEQERMEKNGREDLLYFPHSLTPLTSYTEIIIRAFEEGKIKEPSEGSSIISWLNIDKLSQNFQGTSIDYLTHPREYIEWAQQHELRIGLHTGSAVPSIQVASNQNELKNFDKFFCRVKVYLDQVEGLVTNTLSLPSCSSEALSKRQYSCHKPLIFPKVSNNRVNNPPPHITDMEDNPVEGVINFETPRKKGGRPPIKKYEDLSKDDEKHMLHTPNTEYWSYYISDPQNNFSKEAWKLPHSFLMLLEECSAVIEMSPWLLYKEVLSLEDAHKDLNEHLHLNERLNVKPKNKTKSTPTSETPSQKKTKSTPTSETPSQKKTKSTPTSETPSQKKTTSELRVKVFMDSW